MNSPGPLVRYAVIGLVLAGALVAALFVPGTTPSGEGPEIALVMKSLANEFFLTMEREAREHNANSSEPYRLIANGIRNETDISGQVRIVENMISQSVDAIIIAPADSKALIPVCARAVEAGIVVINIDNRLDRRTLQERSLTIPFVGPDNRDGARKVGEYLARSLQPGDEVAIVEGIETAYNSQERSRGFEEAFAEEGLRVVARRSAEWDMERANVVVTSLISEFPDIVGIACANDSMALGAVAALKAAGRSDDITVVGFDNISAVQQMLETGQILATADQFPGRIATEGIEYALQALTSATDLQDRRTPVELVTRDTIAAEQN